MTEKILQLNTEKNIFWTLLGILLVCTLFYIYSINATIHNIVLRQNLETKNSEITLKLSSEEFQYINMRNGITLALAHSMGFKDISSKTFISSNPDVLISFLTPR